MTYEQVKEINNAMRKKALFQHYYNKKHVRITAMAGNSCRCDLYETKKTDGEFQKTITPKTFSISDILTGIIEKKFYVDNFGVLKGVVR